MGTVDTFFILYFLGIAILWVILEVSERLELSELNKTDWQTHLANDVLMFCLSYYPCKREKPLVKLVKDQSNLSGQYCFMSNTIILYRKSNLKKVELINTVIHEYFHDYIITSKAKYKLYQDQLKEYSYANHPQEILCVAMGKALTDIYLTDKK